MFVGSITHYIKYVKTEEFGDREFPLVFTRSGEVNYALLVFTKHEYSTGGGKSSSLLSVIKVVSDVYSFFELQPKKQSEWLSNPLEMIYAFFEAKLNGTIKTVEGKKVCSAGGLYWKASNLRYVKTQIKAYSKFESFADTYLGLVPSKIDQVMLNNAKKVKKGDPDHKGLLSHLGDDSGVKMVKKKLNHTSEDYGSEDTPSQTKITKYFPPRELTRFILSEKNIHYRAVYVLCAFTGLRASEALHVLIYDITPSDDGFSDIMLSHPITGNTWDHDNNRPISRKRLFETRKAKSFDKNGLDEIDIELLENQRSRVSIADKDNRYKLGWKTITCHTAHHKYGYRLLWSNDYARLYFFKELLPTLLKQQRRGEHPWLFCDIKKGTPMTMGAYRTRMRRHSKAIIDSEEGTHSLRHFSGFYLKNALKQTLDQIKAFLRHANPSSTARYAQPTEEAVRAALRRQEYTEFNDLNFQDLFKQG